VKIPKRKSAKSKGRKRSGERKRVVEFRGAETPGSEKRGKKRCDETGEKKRQREKFIKPNASTKGMQYNLKKPEKKVAIRRITNVSKEKHPWEEKEGIAENRKETGEGKKRQKKKNVYKGRRIWFQRKAHKSWQVKKKPQIINLREKRKFISVGVGRPLGKEKT